MCRYRTFSATVEEYYLLRGYLSDRHLHLICRTESEERNIRTRISASLVLSSEQRNVVVLWLMRLRIWNVWACGCRHGDLRYRPMFFRGFNFLSRYWFSLWKSTTTVTFFNVISLTILSFCNKSKQFSWVVSFIVPGIKVRDVHYRCWKLSSTNDIYQLWTVVCPVRSISVQCFCTRVELLFSLPDHWLQKILSSWQTSW